MLGVLLLTLSFAFRVPVGTVRRRIVRRVRQHQRVIEKERFVLMPLHKVDGVIVDNIRAILTTREIFFDAINFQARVRISRWPAGVLPQAVFIKAILFRPSYVAAKLPLARHTSSVARLLKQVAKGHRLWVHLPER